MKFILKTALRFLSFLAIMLGALSGKVNAQQQVNGTPVADVSQGNFTSFTPQPLYTDIDKLTLLTAQQFRDNPDFGKNFIDKNLPGTTQWYECINKRTLKSRTYIDINDNGRILIQQGYDNLDYVDDNGWIRAVDTKLKPASNGWSAEQQEIPVYLYKNASTALALGHGQLMVFNKNVLFNGKRVSTANHTVGDNGMVIKNAAANTDKIIRFGRSRIETDYRINKPVKLNGDLIISEDIVLPDGYSISANNSDDNQQSSLIVTSADGKPAAEFKAPFCYDNAHNSITGKYSFQQQPGGYRLNVTVPSSWLTDAARQYPIIIDPIVTGPVSKWSGGMFGSCIYPDFDTATIFDTIPAGITVTDIYLEGSFTNSTIPANTASAYFWTPCGDSIIDRLPYSFPSNLGQPLTDFFKIGNTLTKLTNCLIPSCSQQILRVTMGLTRTSGGSGCNTTYTYYDPSTVFPFQSYVAGYKIDTPAAGGTWSVTTPTICGSVCSLTINAAAIDGVPPYTVSHPWATGSINFGGYSSTTCASAGDTTLTLVVPNCPQAACTATPIVVPPPKIIDACGDSIAGLTSQTVMVNPLPNVINTQIQDTFCLGSNVVIPLTSCVTGTMFSWTGSDGASGTDTIKDLPSKGGMVIYTVTPTSPAGCAGVVSLVAIIVGAPFNSMFNVSNATVCVGGTVTATYTGNAKAGSNFNWSSPGGLPSSGINTTGSYSVSYSTTGIDTITLFVTNGNCISTPVKIPISVVTGSPVSVSANPDTICSGQSSKLTASNATTYTWSPAAGLNATTGATVFATPTVSTTYTVSGTAACVSTNTVVVTLKSTGPLNVQPQSVVICGGAEVTLYVSGGGSNFSWSPAAGLNSTTGDSVHASPTADVTYTITGNDSVGCHSSGTDAVDVIIPPTKPIITISVTGDTLFSSAANGNQWFFDDTLIHGATDSFLIIKGRQKGWYYLEVINQANGCASASDSTTDIHQLPLISDEVSIYPNPANSTINVSIHASAKGIADWHLQLTDVLGRTLYTRQSLQYTNAIDLSNLPSGIYFISILNKTARAVFSIVKQN